jgi:hypothetical protein
MKKITAFATKEKDKPLEIHNRSAFNSALSQMVGKLKITVEKYYAKSTPKQFGWLYSSIYPLSMIALNDAGYEFETIDEVDDFWKTLYANRPVLNRETGEIVNVPLRKSKFVTVDQMAYCNAIRQYCAEYLGCEIPEPDINWKKYYEK